MDEQISQEISRIFEETSATSICFDAGFWWWVHPPAVAAFDQSLLTSLAKTSIKVENLLRTFYYSANIYPTIERLIMNKTSSDEVISQLKVAQVIK